ncbi:hypothetical protein GQ44DRAFT_753948 [Phaeosphaeriaceae sp. PMI808]|nr:hypothetical protein GQ44DRAFT_753948 [Phaeosphaeriaceae sp. PMI808]
MSICFVCGADSTTAGFVASTSNHRVPSHGSPRPALPALFGLNFTAPVTAEIKLVEINATIKLELGIWLRQQVAQHANINEHVPTKDPSIVETAAVSQISSHDYHVVRLYLEQYEDLAILADVIGITSSSLDSTVLASVADTLNYHIKAFRAIGAFDPLFRRIAMRYAGLRTTRFPERELVLSLQNLARVAQPDGQLLQLLCYDLGRLDQKNSIAACSPASDSMGEVMHHTGTCSDDEIERILSSGTSMDRQMMARVLRKIVSNLEEHLRKGLSQLDSYPSWFWRLRSFDESTFDIVLHEWMDLCLMDCRVHAVRIALPPLVASGCVGLSNFLEILRTCLSKNKGGQLVEVSATAIDGLPRFCSPLDAYRYRLEQHKLCFESDTRILACIGEVAELVYSIPSSHLQQELSILVSSEPILSIVKQHIGSDSDCLSRMKTVQTGWMVTGGCFKFLLDNLLDPMGHLLNIGLAQMTAEEQVFAVFKVASELSMPICQAAIEHIFSSESMLDGVAADILSGALLNAVKMAVEEDQSQGLELLATLDIALMDKIRYHAEREILEISSFLADASGINTNDSKATAAMLQKYLTVIDLTSSKDAQTNDPSTMLVAIAERLEGISQAFGSFGPLDKQANEANAPSVYNIYAWLNALLRLAVAHSSTLLRDTTYTHQVALMGAIEALLVHPTLELYPLITEHIFDAAIILSDYMSDDTRNQIARLEATKTTNCSRYHFILGATTTTNGWLVLTKPVNIPLNTQTTSQPSTPITGQNQTPSVSQTSTFSQATTQQRYFNSQQQMQQRQQMQQTHQTQQTQQIRKHPQHPQHSIQPSRQLSGQFQRTPSYQASPSSLQQMQHMQQIQGLAQQRATQPSPVHAQRSILTTSQGGSGGPVGGAALGKLQTTHMNHSRELKQYPFVQPRWEVLAESSGNPNLNETAINLGLFGARKV